MPDESYDSLFGDELTEPAPVAEATVTLVPTGESAVHVSVGELEVDVDPAGTEVTPEVAHRLRRVPTVEVAA